MVVKNDSILQDSQKLSNLVQVAKPRVVAAIPCYNEERFVAEVIRRAREYVDEVIVIDDGSEDNTLEVAERAGALAVRHRERMGPGAATRSCFELAKENGADIIVTLDGDNQHNPEEIPVLIAPIASGEADLVIGSRFLDLKSNIPFYRRFGIRAITWLLNVGADVKISDSQCCFRAHSRRLVDGLQITENDFGFSVQILLQARRNGFSIKEVPATCLYHSDGSTINPVRHGLGVAATVVRLRMGRHHNGTVRG